MFTGITDIDLLLSETMSGTGFTDAFTASNFANAVPESSTWMLMLLGLAALGFAFRNSRRRVLFA
jgi:PEP-CTERM motif